MKLCPECKEPPHYHSWCTRCAQLFMVRPESEGAPQWIRKARTLRALREQQIRSAHAAGLTKMQAAARMGCSSECIRYWLRECQLPPLTRKPYGRRANALAS